MEVVDWEKLHAVADQIQRDLDADTSSKQIWKKNQHDLEYKSVFDIWKDKLSNNAISREGLGWYKNGGEYWEDEGNCTPDHNGVLGGFGYLSPVDVRDSIKFLIELHTMFPLFGKELALDCGAGIGRVTKLVLSEMFSKVDLLEQSPRLLNSAPTYMGSNKVKINEMFFSGLQQFTPSKSTYDCCWFQWVLPHLTDLDLIDFLQRCKQSLKPHGIICIKENIVARLPFELDDEDSSITRSETYYKSLFKQAGLSVIHEAVQNDFPDDLYEVKMFALQ